MKRVYFVAIFLLFVLLVVIGFNYSTTSLGGSAVTSTQYSPTDFSFFGSFAATVLVLTSYFLIKHIKEE